jgi:WD repeat-containing protein 35
MVFFSVHSRYCLIVCNALGLAVDNRFIDMEPKHVALNTTHVVAASNDVVYLWEYRYGRAPTYTNPST